MGGVSHFMCGLRSGVKKVAAVTAFVVVGYAISFIKGGVAELSRFMGGPLKRGHHI